VENPVVSVFKADENGLQQHPRFFQHEKKEVDYEELPSIESRGDLDQLEPKIITKEQRNQKGPDAHDPKVVSVYLYNLGQAMIKKRKLMA